MPFQDSLHHAADRFDAALDAVLDNLHADAAAFEASVKAVWDILPAYVKTLQEAADGAGEEKGEAMREEAERTPLMTTQFLIRLREHRGRRGL